MAVSLLASLKTNPKKGTLKMQPRTDQVPRERIPRAASYALSFTANADARRKNEGHPSRKHFQPAG